MGTFQGHWGTLPTVVDRSVRSCASVSRGKRVSNFPIGAMMGTYEDSCADGTHDVTLVDKAAPIIQDENQFGHVSHLPSGRW